MIPRKSLVVKFPHESILPKNLLHHFIRGYFDGDGSIVNSSGKRNRIYIKIASSKRFCDELKTIINKEINIPSSVYTESSGFSVLSIGGMYSSKIFGDWIYNGATIFMARKYERYLALCNKVKELHKAKYKYIYPNKKNGKWISDIYLGNRKTIRLGNKFPTELEAYRFQQNWIKVNG